MTLLSPLTTDEVLFIQRMEEEHNQRLTTYKRNWEYYNGAHKKPLLTKVGQPDDNVIVNLARFVVDKGASFLFGKEVEFQLDETAQTPAEDALDAIWQRNRKMTFLSKVAVSGGIYGHVFIKIRNDDTQDGIERGLPKLENIAPEYVTPFYDDRDIDDVWMYRIQWLAQGRDGKPIHRRQDIRKDGDVWGIENRIARGNSNWVEDPDNPDMVWPWAWCPMIDCQNIPVPNVFWGLSDLEDLSEQDAINYLASKVNRIIRYHAHPKTIGKGFKNADIQIGPDEMLVLPAADSDIWNLEMQSDLGSSLTFLDRLIELFLRQSRIPDLSPTKVNVGALSGFALTILYGDLIDKNEAKRRTYGDMLVELNRRLLDMVGYGADNLVTLQWQPPLPEDPQAAQSRDQFELDRQLASKQTIQERRGLDPETEKALIEEEQQAQENIGAQAIRQFMSGTSTGFKPQGGGGAPRTQG